MISPRSRFTSYLGEVYLWKRALLQPAIRANIPVRVKNSYNIGAAGTIISPKHSGSDLVTAITSKSSVVLVDVTSTRMLGAYGFLAKVFESFARHQLSVDVIASSEVSVSLTLNKLDTEKSLPRTTRGNAIDGQEGEVELGRDFNSHSRGGPDTLPTQLQGILEDLSPFARVSTSTGHSIITLISNVRRASSVMAVVFSVMAALDIQVRTHICNHICNHIQVRRGATRGSQQLRAPAPRVQVCGLRGLAGGGPTGVRAAGRAGGEQAIVLPGQRSAAHLCRGAPSDAEAVCMRSTVQFITRHSEYQTSHLPL